LTTVAVMSGNNGGGGGGGGNSTEKSPSWEANGLSVRQEIPRFLCNPKIHYRVHKSLSLVHILNHMNLVHTITHCLRDRY